MIYLLHNKHDRKSRALAKAEASNPDVRIVDWYGTDKKSRKEVTEITSRFGQPSGFPAIVKDDVPDVILNSVESISELGVIVIDHEALEEERQIPIIARQKLKESGFLRLDYSGVNKYVNSRVTDLATAKTMFKLILVVLVAIRNIIKE